MAAALTKFPRACSGGVCAAHARMWRGAPGIVHAVVRRGHGASTRVAPLCGTAGRASSVVRGVATLCSSGTQWHEHEHKHVHDSLAAPRQQGGAWRAGQRRGFARARKAVFMCGDCGGEHVKVCASHCASHVVHVACRSQRARVGGGVW